MWTSPNPDENAALQTLLLVMNDTITDVNNDELQLMAVEELLPLSGPSSVSVFGKKAASPPDGSRRLLEGTLLKTFQ